MYELYNKTVFIFFLYFFSCPINGDIVMQSLNLEIFGLRNVVVVVAAESEVVGMVSGGEIVGIVSGGEVVGMVSF